MQASRRYSVSVALIVAVGGFLMGFDASVISGVVGFIETKFRLTTLELGWSVASLTLTASLGMLASGPLADRLGRRAVLQIAAIVFFLSAVMTALAPDFVTFFLGRMLGGFGVGAALVVAPMYIAEMAPADMRGRMVSFNQLNIVVGISAAFFSNYLILELATAGTPVLSMPGIDDEPWRWMLGVEALPALAYLAALLLVPESPRWLALKGRHAEARDVLARFGDPPRADRALAEIESSLDGESSRRPLARLFGSRLRRVLIIGVGLAILQQVTGINAVFFYAPMIFAQSGIGTDAAFMQAVLVGLVNLGFTVVAILMIDRLGRRPLLLGGLAGITACMLLLSASFSSASYRLDAGDLDVLPGALDRSALAAVVGVTYNSDRDFQDAVSRAVGAGTYKAQRAVLVAAAIDISPALVLLGILGFVASFAVSVGPVMWVMLSELFPNAVRAMAVSVVGLINSVASFGVQLLFPWELEVVGNAATFLVYAGFGLAGFLFVLRLVPETRGRTLEQLEQALTRA